MDKRVIGVGAVLLVLGGAAYWKYGRKGETPATSGPAAATVGGTTAGTRVAAERPAPATVSGTVRDDAGKPVAAASVQLIRVGDDDDVDHSVTASAAGEYTLRDLPPGDYRASASAVDFVPTAGQAVTLTAGQTATVDLVLVRGGNRVTGVVSDVSGGPVSGATVRFSPIHGILSVDAGDSFVAITDPTGGFALNIADGQYQATASHVDYVPHSTRVELRAGERKVDFSLAPGGVVEGRVLSVVDGAPVPGATVMFTREEQMSLPGGGVISTGGRRGVRIADAQGAFRITGLESGVVRLGARGPGAATADEVTVGLGIGEQVSGVELFVDRARTISGVVQLPDGTPVKDVRVMASGGTGEVRVDAVAPTDAKGAFVIDGVLPGAYRVQVVSDRYLGAPLGVPAQVGDADLTGVVVGVTRGAMISGRVEPAMRADVGLRLEDAIGSGRGLLRAASVRTGADGTFTIGPFSPGAVPLEAIAADGRIGKADVDVAGDDLEDVVIAIEDGASVAGRVVDASGAAVAGATVLIKQHRPRRQVTMIVNGRDVGGKQSPTHEDGSFAVRGLDAGAYDLTVKDANGQNLRWARGKEREAPMKLTLAEAEDRQGVTLQVETSDGVIKGLVRTPSGEPAADVWVRLSPSHDLLMGMGPPPGGPSGPGPGDGDGDGEDVTESRTMMVVAESDDGGGMSMGGALPPVLTGDDGRFEVRGLRRGNYDLLAEGLKGSARGAAKEVATGSDVTIDLLNLSRIDGTVMHGGKPVESFRVELTGDAMRSKNVRDKDGRFALHRVDPGRYTVTVTSGVGSGDAEVEVVPGKPTEVTIDLQTLVAVRGRVTEQGGAPVVGAMVVTTPDRGDGRMEVSIVSDDAPPATGPDGSFEVRVKPGKYRLLVLGAENPGPIAMKPIEVGTEDLDLGTILSGGVAKHP